MSKKSGDIKINKNALYKPYKLPCFKLIEKPGIREYFNKLKAKNIDNSNLSTVERFRLIAKYFKIKLIITKSKPSDEVYGYCIPADKVICIKLHRSSKINKKTFLHELGHIVQWNLNFFRYNSNTLFSKDFRCEQQAETLGYQLSKIFFKEEHFKRKDFMSYFTNKDMVSLFVTYSKWSKGKVKNDLYI